jgi:uncharacterized membrane protein YvbJ
MKFSYDIEDIENIANNWLAILIDEVDRNKSLDRDDVKYIVNLMKEHPKMKRLVPVIIKELFGYYEHSLVEEF